MSRVAPCCVACSVLPARSVADTGLALGGSWRSSKAPGSTLGRAGAGQGQGVVRAWLGSEWAAALQARGAALVRQQVPTALALADAQLAALAAQHNLTHVRGRPPRAPAGPRAACLRPCPMRQVGFVVIPTLLLALPARAARRAAPAAIGCGPARPSRARQPVLARRTGERGARVGPPCLPQALPAQARAIRGARAACARWPRRGDGARARTQHARALQALADMRLLYASFAPASCSADERQALAIARAKARLLCFPMHSLAYEAPAHVED